MMSLHEKSEGFIVWGPLIAVQNFMPKHFNLDKSGGRANSALP